MIPENCHFYYSDGRPCYEVPYADPSRGMRPTTLADARKMDLKPGYTKIAGVLAKPGLDKWKLNQLLMASLTLPRHEGELDDEYAERVIEDAGKQTKKAAERGKSLHSAIERYIRGEEADIEFVEHLKTLSEALYQHGIKLGDGDSETSFGSVLGYGGRVDWRHNTTVLDFKTKQSITEIEAKKQKLVYDEHPMQLAAYAQGLGIKLNTSRCLSVFIGVDDAKVRIFEFEQPDLQRGWLMFSFCLGIWQLQNRFGAFKEL